MDFEDSEDSSRDINDRKGKRIRDQVAHQAAQEMATPLHQANHNLNLYSPNPLEAFGHTHENDYRPNPMLEQYTEEEMKQVNERFRELRANGTNVKTAMLLARTSIRRAVQPAWNYDGSMDCTNDNKPFGLPPQNKRG